MGDLKKLYLYKSRPEFCLKNYEKLQKNMLDKYFPIDPFTIDKQAKVDAESSFHGFLYDAYFYTAFQVY